MGRGPRSPWRLALLLTLAASCSGGADAGDRPNVLVFLVDTLRADHVGAYGYARETSPNMDGLAEEGMLFEQAFAHAPYTATSHATLFTGTYEAAHGLWNKVQVGENADDVIFPILNDEAVTLAEILRDHGYETAGFTDGGMLLPYRGLGQGFETYHARFLGVDDRVARAEEWLADRSREKPFFLFVHTYEAHLPYMPPMEVVDRFDPDYQGPLRQALRDALAEKERVRQSRGMESSVNLYHRKYFKPHIPTKRTPRAEVPQAELGFMETLYDAEIAVADEAFGRLLAKVKELGMWEDTIVILASDHGEEFWEHTRNGHYQVYDELLHVPLIVRIPGGPQGARRSDPVGLIDFVPSLLTAVDLPVPDWVEGRVVDWRRTEPQWSRREMFAAANWPKEQRAYRAGDRKAVFHLTEDRPAEVFDLTADPGETRSLADQSAQRPFLRQADAKWRAWRAISRELGQRLGIEALLEPPEAMSEEDREEMAELGYTGS